MPEGFMRGIEAVNGIVWGPAGLGLHFGTACNVTGDGALTLMLTGYAEKHGIADTGDLESPIL